MVITQRWNSCITWSISLWILTNLIQIELDDLVVLAAFIWHQHVWVFISQGSDLWEETTVLWHQWVTAEKNIHTHFHYYSWVANCEFCTYVPVQSSPGRSSCGGCKGTRRLWLRSRLPCCRLWPFLQTKRLVVLLCYFYNISPCVVLYKSQTSEKENKLPQSGSFFHWPVQEIESTPGPWYSTMAPVPPFTVRMPATFKMTSLGDVQPERVPVSFTPITLEKDKVKILRWEEKQQEKTTGKLNVSSLFC